MKLRNIITKGICEAEAREDGIYIKADWSDEENLWFRYDLETLARGWEYYVEPAEPLIEDKNVRALVRDWLMINKVDGAFRHNANVLRDSFGSLLIVRGAHFKNLKSESFYTIEQLCGKDNYED